MQNNFSLGKKLAVPVRKILLAPPKSFIPIKSELAWYSKIPHDAKVNFKCGGRGFEIRGVTMF